jgi:1-acyl-sn-glycerol-3-phosphate acyltransferase
VESKSIPIGRQIVGLGWFLYLVATCLVLGTAMAISAYAPALLISLGIPKFRAVSDAILQRTVAFMLRAQPWLRFDGSALTRAFAALGGVDSGRRPGLLLVSNHRSHLDTFLLLGRIPGVHVLAKRGLFAVPFLGLVMWTSRQIPVRRRSLKSFVEAMDEIGVRLAAGEIVHVFPEMTRASAGSNGVAPFNPGPFLVAMRLGVPILPLAMTGTSDVWPKGSFSLRAGRPVRAFALAPIRPADFSRFESAKDLAEYCRLEIESVYRNETNPVPREATA